MAAVEVAHFERSDGASIRCIGGRFSSIHSRVLPPLYPSTYAREIPKLCSGTRVALDRTFYVTHKRAPTRDASFKLYVRLQSRVA